jgi:hypothetical protein
MFLKHLRQFVIYGSPIFAYTVLPPPPFHMIVDMSFINFLKLIDLLDLQNDLGGQSCKIKLFLEKLVEQIVNYIYLS